MLRPVVLCMSLLASVAAFTCPDGRVTQEGSTCCLSTSGVYTSCPLPHAVCCEDHVHCCSESTTCDLEHSKCINATESLEMVKRIPARLLLKSSQMVPAFSEDTNYRIMCADKTRCPTAYSCLKAADGFGCCRLKQGVPCSDGKHCCHKGHKCSEDGRFCIEEKDSKLFEKTRDVPCDDTSACPDGTTCCKTTTGEWACCPLPEAVCCDDHVHCCPHGTKCNPASTSCDNSTSSIPWLEKLPSINRQSAEAQNVPCDDTSACPDGSTCCKTTTGEWACCPLPEAVCCDDHVHCCPHGTKCNPASTGCDNSTSSIPWLVKLPSIKRQSAEAQNVPCDDTSACPDGSTCCKTTTGEWACCPLPEAVCCDDHVHCCPHGTKCNPASTGCDNSTSSIPWLVKLPSIKRQSAEAQNVPCDDTSACPDGSTCCKTTTGEWACCPLPEAVCCDDHVHCCPHGTKCNPASTGCDNSTSSIPWLEKLPSIKRQSAEAQNVPCDDTSACPDGSTCCKTTTGEWACCPLPEAVCCDDHVHCCPHGTKCNPASTGCDNSTSSIPWLVKLPSIKRQSAEAQNVPCDDTSACPDGSTCCKTTTGEWACCPLPEAVCCDDHVHCCPHGTKCNPASTGCDNSTSSIPWLEKLPSIKRQSAEAQNVPCDDTSACPDGSTCCKTTTGEWACCPLPEAVCCDDHVHCCPHGTKCNPASTGCDNSTSSIPWLEKLPSINRQSAEAQNVPCDDTSACPDGSTCCKTTTGEWACCPLPEAVCCDDHVHCCPHGTKCNPASTGCDNSTSSIPWLEKLPSINRQSAEAQNVPCDDTSACPDGSTCCKTTTGEWACCPLPEAVCCDDHVHCCPHGTKCNPASTGCDNSTSSIPWLEKLPSINRQSAEAQNVPCDDTSACPDGSTCCKTTTGEWACCPLPEAVCCDDHVHCCPHGTKCNPASTGCDNSTSSIPWLVKLPSIKRQSAEAQNVPCDDTSACPDGSTCCKTTTGEWACCPLPEAVCCDDHVHCCPHGTKCNPASTGCDNSTSSIPWLEKLPSINRQSAEAQNVPCDDTSACPDGSTCCKTTTGEWACCPLPEAVCCDDHVHCCPHGTKCNPASTGCDNSTSSIPWLEKLPSINRQSAEAQNVPCDDTSACPDGSTCCKTTTGEWACCPLPEAVCCDDHVHCCPHGTKCNPASTGCDNSTSSIPWLEKLPSINRQSAEAQNVPCDDTSACPDGSTCCKTTTGEWACCPLPEAVCCDDHVHCCPHGTKCNPASTGCDNSTSSIPWLVKLPSIKRQSAEAQNVPCDDTSACPDGSTCCKTTTGEWACCPLPEAVCCDDHVHCCPHGTKCNPASTGCDNSTSSIPWLVKLPSIKRQSAEAQNVPCDDTSACPDGSTCCKTTTGEWACCPLPEAVCCDDHVHCCPHGTKCNPASTGCDNSTSSIPWLEKLPSIKRQSAEAQNVPCDDTSACPDGSTCCKTTTGEWACCPLPEAVCCDDHVHCCPHGTKCNPASTGCDNSTSSIPWLEKLPTINRQSAEAQNVPCDDTSACPDGSTCCKTTTGEWACCPLPEAICCDDQQHCCPKGYVCDMLVQTCRKSGSPSAPWEQKNPALKEMPTDLASGSSESFRHKCDPYSSCPKDTTCCYMNKTSKWGCCPLPKAVCCEDGEHCCPSGYKCNMERTTCSHDSLVIPWYSKMEAQVDEVPHAPVECNVKDGCASGTPCHQLPSGQLRYCPLAKAVCCSDMQHCCPSGYTCDLVGGSCTKKADHRWDSWDEFITKRKPFIRL